MSLLHSRDRIFVAGQRSIVGGAFVCALQRHG